MSDPKMTDAISRSAAIDIINEERRFIESLRETAFDNEDRAHNTGELGCAIRLARKIKVLPALDVAPVVRCYECKYRCTQTCPMYHTEICLDDLDGFDSYDTDRTDDNGFCYLGARMDGEADE